jgi:hypothetical protein
MAHEYLFPRARQRDVQKISLLFDEQAPFDWIREAIKD